MKTLSIIGRRIVAVHQDRIRRGADGSYDTELTGITLDNGERIRLVALEGHDGAEPWVYASLVSAPKPTKAEGSEA